MKHDRGLASLADLLEETIAQIMGIVQIEARSMREAGTGSPAVLSAVLHKLIDVGLVEHDTNSPRDMGNISALKLPSKLIAR